MRYASQAEERRAAVHSLRREAEIDVKNLGFISSAVVAHLESLGIDAAQMERDLLDKQEAPRG
jgi:hypothetical protein